VHEHVIVQQITRDVVEPKALSEFVQLFGRIQRITYMVVMRRENQDFPEVFWPAGKVLYSCLREYQL
jgi:hypothetical protein